MADKPENPHTNIYQDFAASTADHQLTVENDAGLYRHLKVRSPYRSRPTWEVVTWPKHLTIVGNIADGYTFRTVELDPLRSFFLPDESLDHYSDGSPLINYQRWARALAGSRGLDMSLYNHQIFLGFVSSRLLQLKNQRSITEARAQALYEYAASIPEEHYHAQMWLEENYELFGENRWTADFSQYHPEFILTCYALAEIADQYQLHRLKS